MLNRLGLATARRRSGMIPFAASMLMLGSLLAGWAGPSWALYKVVGPDGKVTYTDRPPVEGKAVTLNANGSSIPTDALPYELQKIVGRFPVTLYTSKACTICDAARTTLTARGIPYREFTVDSQEDMTEFMRRESAQSVPVLRVGGQRLNGFNETDWTSYLDAAGYPKQSKLPPSYQVPPAASLVTPKATGDAGSAAQTRPAARPSVQPSGESGSPPGFRF